MVDSKELIDQRQYAVYAHQFRAWFTAFYDKDSNSWDTETSRIPIGETDECILLPSYD